MLSYPHATRDSGIQLGGFVPFSASDYPSHLACVAFIQGCNWRCSYCHNPHLQSRKAHPMAPQWADIEQFLQQRRGLLDAIVFSGGEPTLDPGLPAAVRQAKSLGFKIGLHTTGAYPKRFAEILPLLTWVGFDFKSSWQQYQQIIAHRQPIDKIQQSLQLLIDSGCDYEVRSTIHSHLHQAEDLLNMATQLAAYGVQHWVLQNFRTEGCIDQTLIQTPHQAESLLTTSLVAELKKHIPDVVIR